MKNSFKQILLIFLVLLFCYESIKNKIERAEMLSEEGKYQDAIKLRNEILEKDENNIGEYINRGADKSSLGKYEEAILDYKEALKRDTTSTLALLNIGNNYKRLNKNDSAIEVYSKAIKIVNSPLLKITYVKNDFLDFTHNNQQNYEVEKRDILYERGLAYKNIEYYLLAIKDFEEASNDFKSVLDRSEETGNNFYWLGFCYSKIKNKEKACEYLIKALNTQANITEEEKYEICD